jgi:hypothetical protein
MGGGLAFGEVDDLAFDLVAGAEFNDRFSWGEEFVA